jgi:hypothetical protein
VTITDGYRDCGIRGRLSRSRRRYFGVLDIGDVAAAGGRRWVLSSGCRAIAGTA